MDGAQVGSMASFVFGRVSVWKDQASRINVCMMIIKVTLLTQWHA